MKSLWTVAFILPIIFAQYENYEMQYDLGLIIIQNIINSYYLGEINTFLNFTTDIYEKYDQMARNIRETKTCVMGCACLQLLFILCQIFLIARPKHSTRRKQRRTQQHNEAAKHTLV